MAKPSTFSRAVAVSISAALLLTAPGLQASAAAATILRALPTIPAASSAIGASVSAAAPLAGAPSLSLSAAPALSLFAAPSLTAAGPAAATIAPLSAAPAVAAAAAPAAAPAAASAVSALAAASAPERPGSPGAAAPAGAPALGEQPWMLTRLFDGARRFAANALPAAADGPDFELPPAAPGRARVTVTLPEQDAAQYEATLRRLEQIYGFKPERAPVRGDRVVTLDGSVPTSTVLALANAKGLLRLQVVSGAPEPTNNPGLKATATRLMKAVAPAPAREPFVAATRRVAELEALTKSDPEKAYAVATEYITGRRETRREVRMAALRALETMPLAKVLPFYTKILTAYAETPVQNAKAAGSDSVWYIQRSVLLRFAREAEALKSAGPAGVTLAKDQYKDRNSSVRLAAGAALRALGEDPGPENEYLDAGASSPILAPAEVHEVDAPRETPPAKQPAKKSFFQRWKLALGALAAVAIIGVAAVEYRSASPAPAAAQTAAPVVQSAPQGRGFSYQTPSPLPSLSAPAAAPAASPAADAPSGSVVVKAPEPTERQILEQNGKTLAEIAKAENRIAAAQEAQAAAQKGGGFMSSIFSMIMSAVIFMGIFWLFGKIRGGMGGMGGGGAAGDGKMTASTEAKTDVEKPTQRFSDIEGIDESLVDVQETLDYLKDPARFVRMGAKAPKGILFEGPPGTGKTLMARALAGETNSAFFAVSGSDFVELFVGMGARRVRELITKAANHKPAIVFIDEIDAVGKARGSGGMSGSNDEREQTINALLTAMDGFDNSGGIIFVAATNRADTLDPALVRPGRFDRKIYVGKPHMGGREAIATIHAKDKRLSPELDLGYLARRTSGLAGADIQGIMNEAALQAVRRGADAIEMQDIDEAIDRGTIGAKRSLPMPEALRRRIAYHEGGHVLANLLNEDESVRQQVTKFTIVPHGSGALGFAEMASEEGDKYLYTKEELEARIDHALGGLVAEKLIFGKTVDVPEEYATNRRAEWSTGPGSDLEVATNIARTMVQTLGMGAATGLAVTAPNRNDPLGRSPFGDDVAAKTWVEVNKILEASYARVTARLTRNRHVLDALAQAVLKKETLIGEEITEIVKKAGPVGPAEKK